MKQTELNLIDLLLGDYEPSPAVRWLKDMPIYNCLVCGKPTLWPTCMEHDERDPEDEDNESA